jgi:RNA polymerase sigma-70 factor (ECF subfamily)
VPGFFLWLLESDSLEKYEPARGRFRSYLKSLLKHFVQHHDEAMGRIKRGGGVTLLPLDDGDRSLEAQLADPRSKNPDAAFDRSWRESILKQSLQAVRGAWIAGARERSSTSSRPTTSCPVRASDVPPLAERFGVKETDVHNALDRVREEIRQQVREELSRSAPDDIDNEWNEFLRS